MSKKSKTTKSRAPKSPRTASWRGPVQASRQSLRSAKNKKK